MNEPRAGESQVAYHRRRIQELKELRQPWESVWRELADYIEPTRLRMNGDKEGVRSRSKIVDSTGTIALRTLASGMHVVPVNGVGWFVKRFSAGQALP